MSHFRPHFDSVNAFDITSPAELYGIARMKYPADDAGPRRIILRFHRHGCPPCDMIEPIWLEFSRRSDYKRVKFVGIDVNETGNRALLEFYHITATPTFVCVENGKPKVSFSGANVKRLQRMIETGDPGPSDN